MFPHKITKIEGNDGKELLELFKGQRAGFVQVGPKKWTLTAKYANHAEKYYSFDLKEDDLWIMTYPRSGTTWMQELLWLVNNKLDYDISSKIRLNERFPFFEFNMIFNDKYLEEVAELNDNDPEIIKELKNYDTPDNKCVKFTPFPIKLEDQSELVCHGITLIKLIEIWIKKVSSGQDFSMDNGIELYDCPDKTNRYITAQTMKSPRHFKTHLPLSLMPPNLLDTCKVVYLARNPFDVAASYYHHNKLIKSLDYQSDFEKYWELFEKDLILYSPYWEHIKEGWEKRNHPNFLFLFYEDLLRDLHGNIRKICKFLNKQMTDDEIRTLADHLHIDNFRKNFTLIRKRVEIKGMSNPEAQGFIRRGKIGGNEEFDDDKIKLRAEKWFKENLAKTDIVFPEF